MLLTRIIEAQSKGRDSSVGIATHYGLDGPWIESLWGARFSAPVLTGTGAQPASYTMGTGSLLGVKRPGRGDDNPPPSGSLWAFVTCFMMIYDMIYLTL